MKIILLGSSHELQWKDSTGDLRKILEEQLTNWNVGLVAEEATCSLMTVAQHLACEYGKPWINIDMSNG